MKCTTNHKETTRREIENLQRVAVTEKIINENWGSVNYGTPFLLPKVQKREKTFYQDGRTEFSAPERIGDLSVLPFGTPEIDNPKPKKTPKIDFAGVGLSNCINHAAQITLKHSETQEVWAFAGILGRTQDRENSEKTIKYLKNHLQNGEYLSKKAEHKIFLDDYEQEIRKEKRKKAGRKKGTRLTNANMTKHGKRQARNYGAMIDRLNKEHPGKYTGKSFITLTIRKEVAQFIGIEDFKKLNVSFLKRLKRFIGNDLMYFWRLEFHKSGVPHIHILTPYFIDKNLINNFWNDVLINYLKLRDKQAGKDARPELKPGTYFDFDKWKQEVNEMEYFNIKIDAIKSLNKARKGGFNKTVALSELKQLKELCINNLGWNPESFDKLIKNIKSRNLKTFSYKGKFTFVHFPNVEMIYKAANYISKYVSKQGKQPIGRIYGISQSANKSIQRHEITYTFKDIATSNQFTKYLYLKLKAAKVYVKSYYNEWTDSWGIYCAKKDKLLTIAKELYEVIQQMGENWFINVMYGWDKNQKNSNTTDLLKLRSFFGIAPGSAKDDLLKMKLSIIK